MVGIPGKGIDNAGNVNVGIFGNLHFVSVILKSRDGV